MDIMCRADVHMASMIGQKDHDDVDYDVIISRIKLCLEELYRYIIKGAK